MTKWDFRALRYIYELAVYPLRLKFSCVMNYLLSGYYGFGNAGDEAVLCSVMDAIKAQDAQAHFAVTSGDPNKTQARYEIEYSIRAIARQNPRALVAAIRSCDVFVSGGGSLLQDVTSLRNVVYYSGLMRLARLMRKPVVVYAQGIGPLNKKLSRKLARAAVQGAQVVTVRDDDSKTLLERIGVRRKIEVVADPVWALQPSKIEAKTASPTWNVALRSWPNVDEEQAIEYSKRTFAAVCQAARQAEVALRFLPMQPVEDAPLAETYRGQMSERDEIVDLNDLHPRDVMAHCAQADAMIAMRLHALIFAAAQGVPCVAINYDPKVESLAKLIGAPLLNIEDLQDANRVLEAVQKARPLAPERLQELKDKAARPAQLAVAMRAKSK